MYVCVCVCMSVCVFPHNLKEYCLAIQVEHMIRENVSLSGVNMYRFLKNVFVAEKKPCKSFLDRLPS